MGNNDVHAYAVAGDYLVHNSIFQVFTTASPHAADTLLKFGYRWGPSVITSFFLYFFRLQGYQLVSVLQTAIFALTFPLIYLFLKMTYKKTLPGMILSLSFFIFNANILYILYHNFFGQILFWGIQSLLFFFCFSYFASNDLEKKDLNSYDMLIGIIISVLYFTYHEGAILIAAAIGFFIVIDTFSKKNILLYFPAVFKIGLVAFFSSSFVIIHATVFNMSYRIWDINAPIGWQTFRLNIPFANPFEIMGFYSIHSFEPMALTAAIFLSILVIAITIFGFWKSKHKAWMLSVLVPYIFFMFWFSFVQKNFWVYNRTVTYGLPFFIGIFSIGVLELIYFLKQVWRYFIIVFLAILVLFNGAKLNRRYIREHIAVDEKLISLKELKNNTALSDQIFSETVVDNSIPDWKQLWEEYFLEPEHDFITTYDFLKKNESVKDNDLFLISKTEQNTRRAVLKNTLWDNSYYRIGRICYSDACLNNVMGDISEIIIGKNIFENILLDKGWDANEEDHRWIREKQASVRLFPKRQFNVIRIEAMTLKKPQEMEVFLDGDFLGKQTLKEQWDFYRFPAGQLTPGTHAITFKFSYLYSPSALGISADSRNLAANIRSIILE